MRACMKPVHSIGEGLSNSEVTSIQPEKMPRPGIYVVLGMILIPKFRFLITFFVTTTWYSYSPKSVHVFAAIFTSKAPETRLGSGILAFQMKRDGLRLQLPVTTDKQWGAACLEAAWMRTRWYGNVVRKKKEHQRTHGTYTLTARLKSGMSKKRHVHSVYQRTNADETQMWSPTTLCT